MLLQISNEFTYGGEKNGKSHCRRESVYSHLSRCIQKKSIESFLEQNGRETVLAEVAFNQ